MAGPLFHELFLFRNMFFYFFYFYFAIPLGLDSVGICTAYYPNM